MWIRMGLASMLATVVTSGLFLLLQFSIARVGEGLPPVEAARIDFTRSRTDSEIKPIEREKVERREPIDVPTLPRVAMARADSSARAFVLVGPKVEGRIGLAPPSLGSAGSDRDVIPLVRIEPEYPARAAARGVEGWVQLRFDITPSGTVGSPVVIDSEPPGVFDRAALGAVGRWKYTPKIENGVAVPRRGVDVLLTFKLEN